MKWRVLYIEDNEDSAYMLTRRLARHGIEVSHAPDAERGLLQCYSEKPQLLILDLDLPGNDGWSVLRMVRENADWKDLPVVIVSSHVLSNEERSALDAGANAFVPKPLDFARLLDIVQGLLDDTASGENAH